MSVSAVLIVVALMTWESWLIVVPVVLTGLLGLGLMGWELWWNLRLRQSNRRVTAIHAEARRSRARQASAEPGDRDVMGETLIDRVHQKWDPSDSHGPKRIVRRVRQ